MICFGSLSYYELEIGVSICLVFGILIVACVAASVAAHALGGHSSPRSIPPHITFYIYLVIMLVVVILSTLPNYTTWRGTHEVYLKCMLPGARCYFVPCAPQGIGEWDQAFSLLIALFLFFYEFESHVLRVIRKGIKILFPLLEALRSLLYDSGIGVIRSTNDNDIRSLLEAGGVPAVQAAGLQEALVPPLQRAFRLTGRARSQATF